MYMKKPQEIEEKYTYSKKSLLLIFILVFHIILTNLAIIKETYI